MSFIQLGNAVHHYVWRPCAEGNAGDAPVVVFSNALGTDHRIWDAVVKRLPSTWSVLRYDTRGHGLSEVGETPYTVAALAADLDELLEKLGLRSVVVCGLSLGGLVAQQLAVTAPERVRALCLCGTAARIGSAPAWRERSEQVLAGGLESVSDAVMARWFGAPYVTRDRAGVSGHRAMLERTSSAGYVAALHALGAADLNAQLGAVRAPVLVLSGELDVATPPDVSRALCAAIAGARFESIARAGHLMCVEEPELVARALTDFVTSLPASREDGVREGASPADERSALGDRMRRRVLGDAHVDRAASAASELDRDFQEYITRAVWGEVWVRPGLPLHTRHLLTVCLLAALNRQEELAMHIGAMRNTGVSVDELKEALMQVAVYAGVPAAHTAIKTAKRVLYGAG